MVLVSRLVYRDTKRFLLAPVIVRTAPGKLHEFAMNVGGVLTDAIPDIIPGSRLFESIGQTVFGGIRQIPRFDLIAIPATVDLVDDLKQDPAVQAIYLDRVQRIVSTVPPEGVYELKTMRKPFTTTLWTKRLIGSEQAEREGFTGKGVKLAVLDTTGAPNHVQIMRAKSYSAIGHLRTDRNGHGTWVASCAGGAAVVDRTTGLHVVGMARNSDLWVIKVLGFVVGMGTDSWILEGIAQAEQIGADVLSLSLGSNSVPPTPEEDVYYEVFRSMSQRGRIIVVAAGNSGPDPQTVGSPGAMPDAFTVGAYDPISGVTADFSSRGPVPWGDVKPDCSAPGVNIYSGLVGTLDEATDKLKNRYSPLSGTSMATPHVSGLICQMIEAARSRGLQITTEMLKDMMRVKGHEKSNEEGWGRIDWSMWKSYMV